MIQILNVYFLKKLLYDIAFRVMEGNTTIHDKDNIGEQQEVNEEQQGKRIEIHLEKENIVDANEEIATTETGNFKNKKRKTTTKVKARAKFTK